MPYKYNLLRVSLPSLFIFGFLLIALFSLHNAVESVVSQTKTLLGHNLQPTPWHLFPKPSTTTTPTTVFRCSYLSCHHLLGGGASSSVPELKRRKKHRRNCPGYFRSVHRDLQPWRVFGVTQSLLDEAKRSAAMRVLIIDGSRLYVELYYACVQSRAMFTIWGLLQLMRRYPGMVPDVDMMFDCMDKPQVKRNAENDVKGLGAPPPLFRYCTTKDHFDIPFPDWSFWGWYGLDHQLSSRSIFCYS